MARRRRQGKRADERGSSQKQTTKPANASRGAAGSRPLQLVIARPKGDAIGWSLESGCRHEEHRDGLLRNSERSEGCGAHPRVTGRRSRLA
jgi:hypothetical protein